MSPFLFFESADASLGAYSNYVEPQFTGNQDLITKDFSPIDTPEATFWSSQFSTVGGRTGYGGFQQVRGSDQSGTRQIRFSVWHNDNSDVIGEFANPEYLTDGFGGEGEGVTIYGDYPFENGSWYRLVQRTWVEGDSSKYGQWVRNGKHGSWIQVGVIATKGHDDGLINNSVMFQEAWKNNAITNPYEDSNKRSGKLTNMYGLNIHDNVWSSYFANNVSAFGGNMTAWDAGVSGVNNSEIWWQTGGGVDPSIENNQVLTINQKKTPDLDQILLDSFSVSQINDEYNVSWKLKSNSSPQFSAKVEFKDSEGKMYSTTVNSYTNSINIPLTSYKSVKLTINDIFNQSADFTKNNLIKYERTIADGTYSILLPGHHSTKPVKGYSTRVLEIRNKNDLVVSNYNGKAGQKFTFKYDESQQAYKIYNNKKRDFLLTSKTLKGINFGNPFVVAEIENQYTKNKEEHFWYVEKIYNGNYLIRRKKDPNLVIDLLWNNPFREIRFQLIGQQPLDSIHTTAQQVNFKKI